MRRKLLIGGWIIILFLIILLFLFSSLGEKKRESLVPSFQVNTAEVTKKENRTIAIDVGEARGMDYDEAFELAQKAGLDRIGLFLAWFILEPSPGNFNGEFPDLANSYYPSKHTPVDLTIAVYNANQKVVAGDLKNKPINDSEVVSRFKSLLDYVFLRMPDAELASLNIGSEMDVTFQDNAKEWNEFIDFYRQAAQYIHEKKPGVPVTAELTFEGITRYPQYAKQVNQYSDQIAISYYGITKDGDAADPTRVHADFSEMVRLYPNKSIIILQFGYPSSEYLGGSLEKQAQFIHEAFLAWDKHANAISLIDFTWLHDMSPAGVKENAEFYGISDKKFTEYLGSLGLRTYDGEDKPAFWQFKVEAAARGWGKSN